MSIEISNDQASIINRLIIAEIYQVSEQIRLLGHNPSVDFHIKELIKLKVLIKSKLKKGKTIEAN